MTQSRHISRTYQTEKTCRRSGMILIFTLMITAALSGLALLFLVQGRYDVELQQHQLDSARLRHAASQMARVGMDLLTDDDSVDYDALTEDWAKPRAWTTPEGIHVTLTITDENRAFDLNNLSLDDLADRAACQTMFLDILTDFGDYLTIDKMQALTDWIDADDAGSREKMYYQKYGDRMPPNAPLQSWAELERIAGFETFQSDTVSLDIDFRAYFSLIPLERRSPIPVNINTASPNLLRALARWRNASWIEFILVRREITPIQNMDALLIMLPEQERITIRKYFSTISTVFRMNITASLRNTTQQLQVIVQRSDKGCQGIRWIYN